MKQYKQYALTIQGENMNVTLLSDDTKKIVDRWNYFRWMRDNLSTNLIVRLAPVARKQNEKRSVAEREIKPAYTSKGFPLIYINKDNKNILCNQCASSESIETEARIHLDGSAIECYECEALIESALGNPYGDYI